jgi:hypothetical protein
VINKKMMQSTHSLQLKKKKQQHSIRFLFFDQLFRYYLEIRNSFNTRSSAFFFRKTIKLSICYLSTKKMKSDQQPKKWASGVYFLFSVFFNSSMTLKIRVSSALYNDYYT